MASEATTRKTLEYAREVFTGKPPCGLLILLYNACDGATGRFGLRTSGLVADPPPNILRLFENGTVSIGAGRRGSPGSALLLRADRPAIHADDDEATPDERPIGHIVLPGTSRLTGDLIDAEAAGAGTGCTAGGITAFHDGMPFFGQPQQRRRYRAVTNEGGRGTCDRSPERFERRSVVRR